MNLARYDFPMILKATKAKILMVAKYQADTIFMILLEYVCCRHLQPVIIGVQGFKFIIAIAGSPGAA